MKNKTFPLNQILRLTQAMVFILWLLWYAINIMLAKQ